MSKLRTKDICSCDQALMYKRALEEIKAEVSLLYFELEYLDDELRNIESILTETLT